MYHYTYLFLATISSSIAVYALYILFQSIDTLQTPSPPVDQVQKQLNDTDLSSTGLTQFKLLDTHSTAQTLMNHQYSSTDQPGNAAAQNTVKGYQKSFDSISNISYLQNKDIYD